MTAWRNRLRDLARTPRLGDAALAAAVLLISVAGMGLDEAIGEAPRRPDAVAVAILVAQAAALFFRRQAPMPVYAAVGVLTVLYSLLGYPASGSGLAVLVAIYTVATLLPLRQTLVAAGIYMVGMITSVAAYFDTAGQALPELFAAVAFNAVILVLALVVGVTMRTRRDYVRELEARNQLLESTREEQARLAIALERGRIARELHDEVAHALSIIVVQAGAAERVLDREPARAAEALRVIRETGRSALDEMRRMLVRLRTEGQEAELTPQPGLADLDDLVQRVAEAGLPVELAVQGTPRRLPQIVELSAYRIVQEALTNTLKHAGPARARVLIRYAADALELRVTDTGHGPAAETRDGHGIIGMRERVAVFDGRLVTGPRPEGGFAVEAHIPIESRP